MFVHKTQLVTNSTQFNTLRTNFPIGFQFQVFPSGNSLSPFIQFVQFVNYTQKKSRILSPKNTFTETLAYHCNI